MKATIILAHPWHGSFNKSILDLVLNSLSKRKKEYNLIDLNKDKFNPVLTEEELALFSKGKYKDDLVGKYQKYILESDELIIIFPIWWFNLPASLKGFFDKVMLKNFAYDETSSGLKGKLSNIKKTTVITTSESPTWYLKTIMGNPIKNTLIKGTLKGVGIKNIRWINKGAIKSGGIKSRENFLENIDLYFRQ